MPTVFIPAILRPLTAGATEVAAGGATLRAVIEDVERQYPGLQGRVLENGSLRPELFIAIGSVEAFDLDVPVEPGAEVFILPAIAGGSIRAPALDQDLAGYGLGSDRQQDD